MHDFELEDWNLDTHSGIDSNWSPIGSCQVHKFFKDSRSIGMPPQKYLINRTELEAPLTPLKTGRRINIDSAKDAHDSALFDGLNTESSTTQNEPLGSHFRRIPSFAKAQEVQIKLDSDQDSEERSRMLEFNGLKGTKCALIHGKSIMNPGFPHYSKVSSALFKFTLIPESNSDRGKWTPEQLSPLYFDY